MNSDTPRDVPAAPDDQRRPGLDAAMRAELAHISADPIFKNSPTLSRLLQYLVEETLGGRGDRIKAYSIAVDGLGRPSDFDAQSDSYPRVQVGRLRKALSSFYAKNIPRDELCLFVTPGSYKVRLGRPATAYPELFRPLSDSQSASNGTAAGPEADTSRDKNETGISRNLRWRSRAIWIALVLAAIITTFALVRILTDPAPTVVKHPVSTPQDTALSPLLFVTPVAAPSNPRTADLARNTFAVLTDGLSRSWIARVRADPLTEAGTDPASVAAAYRLDTQLDEGEKGSYVLFARLTEARTATVIWSTSLSIVPQNGSLAEGLAPLMSQISGPYGAIAAQESHRLKDSFDAGYPCLLQYLNFLASRDPHVVPAIKQCLAQPSEDSRLEALRLAFGSVFALSSGNVGRDRADAVRAALINARKAIEIDPNEAYAHFALARIAFVGGDCGTGVRHAKLAVTANPYDPIILSTLGGFTSLCGDDEGRAMLEQAYRFYVPGNSYARLQLILAQIQQGHFDRLSKLTEIRQPRSGASLAYYYLCETLISAGLGHTDAASANWSKFVAASAPPHRSNDAMLSSIILSEQVRSRVLAFLEMSNVIGPEAAPK